MQHKRRRLLLTTLPISRSPLEGFFWMTRLPKLWPVTLSDLKLHQGEQLPEELEDCSVSGRIPLSLEEAIGGI